jgi:hypothetical protein
LSAVSQGAPAQDQLLLAESWQKYGALLVKQGLLIMTHLVTLALSTGVPLSHTQKSM